MHVSGQPQPSGSGTVPGGVVPLGGTTLRRRALRSPCCRCLSPGKTPLEFAPSGHMNNSGLWPSAAAGVGCSSLLGGPRRPVNSVQDLEGQREEDTALPEMQSVRTIWWELCKYCSSGARPCRRVKDLIPFRRENLAPFPESPAPGCCHSLPSPSTSLLEVLLLNYHTVYSGSFIKL